MNSIRWERKEMIHGERENPRKEDINLKESTR
jgi:hypothetical protein